MACWFDATKVDPTPPLIWPPIAARAPQSDPPPLAARSPRPGDAWPKQDKPVPPPSPVWPPIAPAPDVTVPSAAPIAATAVALAAAPARAMLPLPVEPEQTIIRRDGRDYSPAFAKEFCDLIADGGNVRSLCKRSDMPSRATIREWTRRYDAFAMALGNAERTRASARLDLMDEMCEDVINGKLDPDYARVVLQHYKWAASVEDRGKFGDRLGVQPLPSPAMPFDGDAIKLDHRTPEESARIVAAVLRME
jgi:hypothetical protein